MPGVRRVVTVDASLCRRCQVNEPTITVRTEPLCKACFARYVNSKVVKRMESFRVRHAEPGQERRLLLPMTFEPSSLALLHILDQHLRGQNEKTGRTGFRLHVVLVDDGRRHDTQDLAKPALDRLKSAYPAHEYHVVDLADVLAQEDVRALVQQHRPELDSTAACEQQLQALLATLGSATAQVDAQKLLSRKLIVACAKAHACEAVLWDDSTTRLAEKTLAETAKGRGFSLPWAVADGESPYGVAFFYPLRDLLTKEIEAYMSFLEPSLDDLIRRPVVRSTVSARHTTIDDLMTQYFAGVEREYPSIVANVVKTTGKLQPMSLRELEQHCELCEMPLDGQAPEKSRLCYGCIRTLPIASNG